MKKAGRAGSLIKKRRFVHATRLNVWETYEKDEILPLEDPEDPDT